MKKYYLSYLCIGFFLLSSMSIHGQIISQYIETNSGTTPKGVEIWNNTGSTLDFSTNNLVIEKGTNGASPSTDVTVSSGTLAPGHVMVIGTSDMGTYLTDEGLTDVTYVSKSFTFNGDDALVVKYGGTTTDMFGVGGSDPGSSWSGSGVDTRNQNIRLIDETDGAGTGISTGDTDGWTDPSTRFVTVSSTPSTLPAGLEGFGIAPITTVWDGSSDTDWSLADNWSNGVPTSSSNVSVPDLTNAPVISSSTGAEVNDLTISETDGVTISSGGSLIVSGTSSGNITYNRTLGTTNWYLVGIPVAGETIEDMITNNSFASGSDSNIGLAPYDNSQATAADRWDYQTAASTGSLTSGGGYSVKLASSGTLTFTGTMQTADVGVSITDNSGGSGNAFNLVGNPYPSYLAANSNADGTNNLLTINNSDLTEATLWLWNQSSGTYETYNQASSSFHIAPGQGFFVSSTGSNTFNFTEAMQSHQGTDTFRTTDPNNRPEIELGITDGTDSRKADIFYIDGTTTSFDNGFDSSMFGGASSSFAIYTGLVSDSQGQKLSIQSLPPSNFENMIIPVGVNATSGTEITISSTSINLPTGIKVFLEDKNDNSFTELSATSDFTTTLSEDMNGTGRFYLHTSTEALSTDTVTLDYISIYPTNPQNLKVTGVHSGNLKVAMFNILGSKVLSTSVLANGSNDIPLPSLTSGVYIVQVETESGSVNKKIIIE